MSAYNQNYQRNQIEDYLDEIKECIARNSIAFAEEREKNRDFHLEYQLTYRKKIDIVNKLKCDDFCHTLNNYNRGFEDEVLYVFVPVVILNTVEAVRERVSIYLKFNLLKHNNSGKEVIISFHKLERPIDYKWV